MKKLQSFEISHSDGSLVQLDIGEIERIKLIQLNRLEYGQPENIDTLSIVFQDYNWTSVERAITDMSNDGIVNQELGDSQLKITGIYATITRI